MSGESQSEDRGPRTRVGLRTQGRTKIQEPRTKDQRVMQNRSFATTRWSLVLAAGRDSTAGSRAALSELCELYWRPVYAFARRQGYEVHDAEDLTQAFFARLLEKHVVQAAD